MGCPTSSQTTWRSPYCVKIAAGEFGSDRKTWIRVPALQPLEKALLGPRLGLLDGERLELVQSRIADYLGMLDAPEGPSPQDDADTEAGRAWDELKRD